MELLEGLASGTLPESFPFQYTSPFDEGSPWSLIVALFPETSQLPALEFAQSDTPQPLNGSVRSEIVDFVRSECRQKGWCDPLPEGETTASYFLKVRMRLTDSISNQLNIPRDISGADVCWLDGCVRVLKLWRKMCNTSRPSLLEFEPKEPDNSARMFEQLTHIAPVGWGLKQRLEFFLVPYARYADRIDLLQEWCHELPIDELSDALFVKELTSQLLCACLDAPVTQWRAVRHIVDNIPHAHFETHETADTVAANIPEKATLNPGRDALAVPTKDTIQLMIDLVAVARVGKLPAEKFRQLAEWSVGPKDIQQDVLRRLLLQSKHVSNEDLNTMRSTVFSKIDESAFIEESISIALLKSRFMFLKSLPLEPHRETLKRGVLKLVDQFDAGAGATDSGFAESAGVTLQQVLTALEFLDDDDECHELKQKYSYLMQLHSTFSIDPHFVLTHDVNAVVAKALELDPSTYVRYTDLATIIGRGDKDVAATIAEQCVESALANDDFPTACEYFERGFIKDSSSSAWLSYYETGNYMSPQWNAPKSVHVLEKQKILMSKSLDLCPEDDIMTVLKAWHNLEAELAEVEQQTPPKKNRNSPVGGQTPDASPETADPRPAVDVAAGTARDQLSNLLVSGLGWAIGAKP